MNISTLTTLPTAPSRFASPSTFEQQVDAYLAGQANLVTEMNTIVSEINTDLETFINTEVTTQADTQVAAALSSSVLSLPEIYTTATSQASSSTTLANITSLSHTMVANAVYRITAYITFRSAATTTGINLGYTSPSGSDPRLTIHVPTTSSASSTSLVATFPAAGNTISGSVLGTGVLAINSDHTATVQGIVKAGSTGGAFNLQFATEVASSAITIQAGSIMVVERLTV